jgi:hypothetical protein
VPFNFRTRRLQILVDDERFKRLAERERAGQRLLAMTAPSGSEPNWEDQKQEMLDAPIRKWPGA